MSPRKLFAALLGLGILMGPLEADAQQPGKVPRIGFLSGQIQRAPSLEPFSKGLRELGYTDYKDFVVEYRVSGGDSAVLPGLAAELVDSKVDVIVAVSTLAALAAKKATAAVPIVAVTDDPVGSGLVTTLGRPGGNVTGLSSLSPELGAKRLELLKETVPRAARVAVLWSPVLSGNTIGLKEMETAAPTLGVKLLSLGPRRPAEYDGALGLALKEKAGALVFLGSGNLSHPAERHIVELAKRRRLPVIYDLTDYVEAGGLLAYGASRPVLFRRAAFFVDKILKGAKPADLPVEQPTRFELVINLKTAKALGLTIPPSILIRADQVIQ